jgi:hypothetical protein
VDRGRRVGQRVSGQRWRRISVQNGQLELEREMKCYSPSYFLSSAPHQLNWLSAVFSVDKDMC